MGGGARDPAGGEVRGPCGRGVVCSFSPRNPRSAAGHWQFPEWRDHPAPSAAREPRCHCHRHHWCSCTAPSALRIPALAFGGGTGATPRLRATAGPGTGASVRRGQGQGCVAQAAFAPGAGRPCVLSAPRGVSGLGCSPHPLHRGHLPCDGTEPVPAPRPNTWPCTPAEADVRVSESRGAGRRF